MESDTAGICVAVIVALLALGYVINVTSFIINDFQVM